MRTSILMSLGAALGCGSPTQPPAHDAPDQAGPLVSSSHAASARVASFAHSDDATFLENAAIDLAQRCLLVDTHIDVPMRLDKSRDANGHVTEDVTSYTQKGDFDWPRARKGGLDAAFMSIYIPSKYELTGGGKQLADRLIDAVEEVVRRAPDKFARASSPGEVRANFAAGKISLPLGMENGTPLSHDLANLEHFHRRGIRYITLVHAKDNHIADSSFDTKHTHGGLSEFGRDVIMEMNRLGIMIDVSHASDQAFWQILALSRTPVIASHSSCRHFTPGWERNMSDEMIVALAERGGVVHISFGSSFIDDEVRKIRDHQHKELQAQMAMRGLEWGTPESFTFADEWERGQPSKFASVEQVADHFDHVVRLVGVEHVGFGSDFDGVGDSLPEGLKDVSAYPNLIRSLLVRGYRESDIHKICGENLLRVWQVIEDAASR